MTIQHTLSETTKPVLVIGATGKIGRRVADLLDARGVDVRRASRSSATRFDWTDRTTWAPALDGAGPVYISYQPDLIVPGAVDDVAELVRLAESAGVTRLVLLAGRGEPEADAAGRVVHASAIDATVLSCAWFDQNFSEGGFAPEIAMGSLTLPVGAVGEPFIDAEDIASVAVAALLDRTADVNPHAGRTYDLTGPRLLTFAEAAAEIGRARGVDLAATEVTLEEYRQMLSQYGLASSDIDLLVALFGTLFDGRNSRISGDVERVLGRPARDFADFVNAAVVQEVS
ncbi:MAG: NmrA family transcriptional regulator [Actinomycetota bacterium]|nr:NmrA family transcriptional regulator [Actinomycetota bacterium]